MKFNLQEINHFYNTGKLKSKETISEKENFILFAKSTIEKIINKNLKNINLTDLKLLSEYTSKLHPLLLNEIIPYEYLDNPKKINFKIDEYPTKSNLHIFYENLTKLYYIENISRNVGLNIITNLNEVYEKLISFNSTLNNLSFIEYYDFLKKLDSKNILEIKQLSKLDILPGEIIFKNEQKFKDFLIFISFLYQKTLYNQLSSFISEVVQKNTIKLFYEYFKEKKLSYESKFNKFLDFYEQYISNSIYISDIRKDFIQIFGELFKNFKRIHDFKDKYLLRKQPDRLLRFAYIKYYPDLKEIIEDITSNESYSRLNLGFVSTIAFFERIYEKGWQHKYHSLIKTLYQKLIMPKIDKYTISNPSKIEYLNNFLKKYPEFKNYIYQENTKLELTNNLAGAETISDYIQLHKEGKINKKLNKKDLKKLINDTIHYNEIKYLLENNLVNIKKLSDFIDLCIPHLTTSGLILLGVNNQFKNFLSKQKLLKLLKEKKDIKYLILLEKFAHNLSNKEQKEIINMFKKSNNTIQLIIVNGCKLIDDKYTKVIEDKIKAINYFLQ